MSQVELFSEERLPDPGQVLFFGRYAQDRRSAFARGLRAIRNIYGEDVYQETLAAIETLRRSEQLLSAYRASS